MLRINNENEYDIRTCVLNTSKPKSGTLDTFKFVHEKTFAGIGTMDPNQ